MGTLRRSRTDRWIGGVCGGLAKELGIESWIVRLAWILLLGVSLFVYFVLWLVIPEDGEPPRSAA